MTAPQRSPISPRPRAAAVGTGVAVRPISTLAEFQACVALQEEVWGPGFGERVPVSLMKVATYIGGLAIGAFGDDRRLLGFVFGLTGIHDGRTLHWSHLLGVLPSERNLGIGQLLKERQRDELARVGIAEMCWTFDPLVGKNAHLNLNVLGARVLRYEPNMYGTTVSRLHHGIPTDRLVVSLSTSEDGARRPTLEPEDAEAPLLTLEPRSGDLVLDRSKARPPRIRVELPSDFQQLATDSPGRAAEWHSSVRTHLMWALEHGYDVAGLLRDAVLSRSFYALTSTRRA